MWKALWDEFLARVFGGGFGAEVAAREARYLGHNVRKSIDRDEILVTKVRVAPGQSYTVVARPPATKRERQLAGAQEKLRDRKRKLDRPSRSQLKAARRLARAQKRVDRRSAGGRRRAKAERDETERAARFDRVMTRTKKQRAVDAALGSVTADLDAERDTTFEQAWERRRDKRPRSRQRFYYD